MFALFKEKCLPLTCFLLFPRLVVYILKRKNKTKHNKIVILQVAFLLLKTKERIESCSSSCPNTEVRRGAGEGFEPSIQLLDGLHGFQIRSLSQTSFEPRGRPPKIVASLFLCVVTCRWVTPKLPFTLKFVLEFQCSSVFRLNVSLDSFTQNSRISPLIDLKE